jgi:NAD(P)-dependent dehydrogenase (short-subunit alcohol dehydrogenase family)
MKQVSLITGASSGFGALAARALSPIAKTAARFAGLGIEQQRGGRNTAVASSLLRGGCAPNFCGASAWRSS